MQILAQNRKAYHDYQILERLEAGIKLFGPEVKSIKQGRVKIAGSFVKFLENEPYIFNMHVPKYAKAGKVKLDPDRKRKLLLNKQEAQRLFGQLSKKANLTLVPVSVYNKQGLIKVELGVAKGKKKYDKRETLKRRQIQRDIERELRGKE